VVNLNSSQGVVNLEGTDDVRHYSPNDASYKPAGEENDDRDDKIRNELCKTEPNVPKRALQNRNTILNHVYNL